MLSHARVIGARALLAAARFILPAAVEVEEDDGEEAGNLPAPTVSPRGLAMLHVAEQSPDGFIEEDQPLPGSVAARMRRPR